MSDDIPNQEHFKALLLWAYDEKGKIPIDGLSMTDVLLAVIAYRVLGVEHMIRVIGEDIGEQLGEIRKSQ